jgi:hypothetical protein
VTEWGLVTRRRSAWSDIPEGNLSSGRTVQGRGNLLPKPRRTDVSRIVTAFLLLTVLTLAILAACGDAEEAAPDASNASTGPATATGEPTVSPLDSSQLESLVADLQNDLLASTGRTAQSYTTEPTIIPEICLGPGAVTGCLLDPKPGLRVALASDSATDYYLVDAEGHYSYVGTGTGDQGLLDAALADLSSRLGVERAQIQTRYVDQVNFNNNCLGLPAIEMCPPNDGSGLRITLSDGSRDYFYHAATQIGVVLVAPKDPPRELLAKLYKEARAAAGSTSEEPRVLYAQELAWPNGCLGVNVNPDDPNDCPLLVFEPTGGFRVLVQVGGRYFTYHTDSSSVILLAEQGEMPFSN